MSVTIGGGGSGGGSGGAIAGSSNWLDVAVANQIADRYRRLRMCTASSFGYDNGGTDMEIGGTKCHLCGAAKTIENVYGKQKKSGWKNRRYVEYKCGTTVHVSAEGENLVTVGEDCLQVG